MIRNPGPTQPRSTNNYPWVVSIPFNFEAPFANGSLGCLMNTGGQSAPTAATYRDFVSPGNQDANAMQSTGALEPIANPTNLGTGYYWYEALEKADIVLIQPYLVLYSSSSHTAYASAAAKDGLTAKLHFYLIREIIPGSGSAPNNKRPAEYTAEYKGGTTILNSANRVNSGTKIRPTGAQWAYTGTTIADETIDPGIKYDGDLDTGSMRIRFDQEGAIGLLTRVSDLTSTSTGVGWLRSHL